MPFRRQPNRRPAKASRRVVDNLIRSRIPVDLLGIGMRVIKLDRPWTEVPVLFQGFTIDRADQLSILRQYCEWVWVEALSTELTPVLEQIEIQRRRRDEPMPEQHPIHVELPRARKVFESTSDYVRDLLDRVESGVDVDLSMARPLIQRCAESITANPSAMFWMNRIKHRDAYTAEHCQRVAILAMAFARYLGMSTVDMETAGLCGLLHDIGKMQVPHRVLNKPGALNAAEMEIVRQHTRHGHDLLRQQDLDPIVATVCLDHHERLDGAGYPRGLQAWQISRFARLVAIVDVFDAITSDRCYRAGLPTTDAMRILYRERDRQFDAGMIEAFIRMIGVYPPGSLVELNSGEVAVVISNHPSYKLRPRVEILLGPDKQSVPPQTIDLKDEPCTTSGQLYTITAPLPDGAYGVTLSGRIETITESA